MRHRRTRLTPIFTQYAVFTFPRQRLLKLVLLPSDRAAAESAFRMADRPCAWVCLGHRPSVMETAGTQLRAADLSHDEHFWDAVRKAVLDHRG
jgi:hypothetical protein